ncbi:MAG TPA: chloride channel protein [Ohtaekwangia sp.]|nr:chloride channel protein [Ohtaekwangia sp.]
MKRLSLILKTPILFLRDKLSNRQFFILSSILVGLGSGLAAIVLKYFVHSIERLISFYSHNYEEFFLFAFFPLIGISLTVFFVRFFLHNKLKRGSAEVVYSIVKNSSILPSREVYSHVVTSGLTVGFGGSVGLESPMVNTGAAIGSTYGRIYKLSYKERTILLACGASAGIATAFNSPIAGVLFAIEVLLADVSAAAFIPLIISAASGALLSRIILTENLTLSFSLQEPFNYMNMPWYIALGIVAGLISLYFARTFIWIEHRMSKITNRIGRVLIAGMLLFVLVLLFPPLYGEGYESIRMLSEMKPEEIFTNSLLLGVLDNEVNIMIFLGFLVFLKTVAAAITVGSGGNGGNFGPSLFVGAYLGYVFSKLINFSGLADLPENNFMLVAMAGILSGVFYAPLTAIFLIAEITGGYGLMIPLMTVSALSLIVVHYFEPLSMDAKKLSRKLNLSVDNRDTFLLSKLDLAELIETNFSIVRPDDNLQKLIEVISKSKRNTFPVINEKRELVGLVHMDNIRSIIFSSEKPEDVSVNTLMDPPAAVIHVNENLHSVLEKFDETNLWNLPVVDKNQYLGFVSKSSVLTKYRAELLKTV